MFRPFRLLMLGTLALAGYVVFFAVPGGTEGTNTFDADQVATFEVEIWKNAKVHAEMPVFVNAVQMMRELHHATWFRAVQEGYYVAHAWNTFPDLTSRYERILPDLEDAATVEKTVRGLSYDPAVVARAQLTWMVTAKMPDQANSDQAASLMAEEYSLRYRMRADQVFASAAPRAEAFKIWINTPIEPDYATITKLLMESYRSMRIGMERAGAPRATAR